jgi:hypothetical protein
VSERGSLRQRAAAGEGNSGLQWCCGGGRSEDSEGGCRVIWRAMRRGLTWIYRKARGKVTRACAVACGGLGSSEFCVFLILFFFSLLFLLAQNG